MFFLFGMIKYKYICKMKKKMKREVLKKSLLILLLILSISVSSQKTDKRPSEWAKKISSTKFTNLYMLNDSIYRCEQPDSLGFTIIKRLGIKSVLNLRSKHKDDKLIYRLPLNLYNVEMKAENINDEEIINALKVLRNSPKPVIVHCMHGSDRTGAIIAMYRIVYQKWTKEQALNEMKNGGYGFHKVYANITHYINKVDVDKMKNELQK